MILKVNAGKYKVPLELTSMSENRLKVKFRFNRKLIIEIKNMRGARWHPEEKFWSIEDCSRNWFNLRYLEGHNMYARYDNDLDLTSYSFTRPLYEHQKEMAIQGLQRRRCIFACEMGTGKSLAAYEVMERGDAKCWWWIGPKSALKAVEYDMIKWNCMVAPKRTLTYDKLKSVLENWTPGEPAPDGVILDESSKIKNENTQRSQAVMRLREAMDKEHEDPYIIEMSGSPAPKDPSNWWHQVEVACPGFLSEGAQKKLKNKLSLIVQTENLTGGMYPKLVTWWDDENKCKTCGMLRSDPVHDKVAMEPEYHVFEKSINEVHRLYKRMKGLVLVKFKKDCLDLPEKVYQIIQLKPNPGILRAAKIIAARAPRVISALILLRQLSDGFQYDIEKTGTQTCELCQGGCEDPHGDGLCPNCAGTGVSDELTRTVKEVASPKADALQDLLDSHESRIVVFAGFTASVDRVIRICQATGWKTIRMDGRGWDGPSVQDFQENFEDYPKLAFVGQSGAGGMGLTLTASPTIVYWSNDFNAESRIQSEDRIHRIGTKGATIIDLIHLPSDTLILDNLKAKRKLQDVSLGKVKEAFDD